MSALIWTAFKDEEQAKNIAKMLVEERLVGCANILGPVQSMFLWKGQVEESSESAVLLKTDGALLKSAVARLEYLHPYETPAIVGWHCDEAADATLQWLGELNSDDAHGGASKT